MKYSPGKVGKGKRMRLQNSGQFLADDKGVTLIEIIMIIVLIGIVSISVLPKFISTSTFSLEGASVMIAADIRYTQELAMGSHTSKSIIFNSGDTFYTVDSRTVNLPSKVSISNNKTFTFNSLGEPTAGGGTSVIVDSGGSTRTITVGSYTGKITVS